MFAEDKQFVSPCDFSVKRTKPIKTAESPALKNGRFQPQYPA